MEMLRRRWAVVEVTTVRPYLLPAGAVAIEVANGVRTISKHWFLWRARGFLALAEENQGNLDEAHRRANGGHLRYETSFYVEPI